MSKGFLVPITRNVVLISGFNQTGGMPTTGLDTLDHKLHSAIASPDTRVRLHVWDDDFKAIAAQIEMRRMGRPTTIDVIAYSWGVGNGALNLANELAQYGLVINRLYSIDGVYRHWIPLRALFRRTRWLAPTIKIPWNILHTTYWRQETNIPQGHRLIPTLDSQIIVAGNDNDGILPATHQQIDNDASIQNTIFREIIETKVIKWG